MHPGLRDYITDLIQQQYYMDPDSSNLHYIAGQLTEQLQEHVDPPIPNRARLILHRADNRWGDYVSGIPWPPAPAFTLDESVSPYASVSYIRDEIAFKPYRSRLNIGNGRDIEIRLELGYSEQFNQIVIRDERRPDEAAMLKARAEQIKRMEEAQARRKAEAEALIPRWKKSIYIVEGWRTAETPQGSLWAKLEQFGQRMRVSVGGGSW